MHGHVTELSPGRHGMLDHLDEPVVHLRQRSSLQVEDGCSFPDTHVAPDEHAARFGAHEKLLSELGHLFGIEIDTEFALRDQFLAAVSRVLEEG